jgi:diaminopimelate epimerase
MCANGIRSIGQYYFSKYPNQAEIINIDTLSGETAQVYKSGELFTARLSEVNIFNKENIEKFNGILSCDPINLINSLLKNKQGLELISVSEILLEPHIIINAQPEISREELAILAKQIVTLQDNQGNPVFPNGININFIHQNSLSKLSVLTYERGVNDFTRACGTGVICSSKHILDLNNNQPVQITTAGGELLVEYDIEHYYLTGPATILGNIEI